MWQLLAGAGLQAASSLFGASQQDKAAKNAAAESARAAAEARAALGENRDFTQQLYGPTVEMGQNILGQLAQNYGVGAGTPDWNTYVVQNPDVLEIHEIMNGQRQGTPGQMAFIQGFQQSGKSHLGEYHASVVPGRQVPVVAGTEPKPYVDPTAPQGYAPAPYVMPTRPQVAPLDVGLDKYQASPDYLYQLTEGSKNLNANFGAKGLLQSGAAMKALQQFGQDTALGDYAQWRQFKTGQYQFDAGRTDQNYNFDANFGRGVYESDRNYGASRYDQSQNRLFDLAGFGERAMGRTADASSDYARGVAGITTNNGQVQGQAKIASANAWSNGLSSAAGAFGNILGGMGSSYGATPTTAGATRSYGLDQFAIPITPGRTTSGGYQWVGRY